MGPDKMTRPLVVLLLLSFFPVIANAIPIPSGNGNLSAQEQKNDLDVIQNKILTLQKGLIQNIKDQSAARKVLGKTKELLGLYRQEHHLSEAKHSQLLSFVEGLKNRRELLQRQIASREKSVRVALARIRQATGFFPSSEQVYAIQSEKFDGPRRKVLVNLVHHQLREIEALKADRADAEHLESQINGEQEQLTYLLQDLREKEEVLKFHEKLQTEDLKKTYHERIAQLERYHRLKESEQEVSRLITHYRDRVEFEKNTQAEREAGKAFWGGDFLALKGQLSLPVFGKVVSHFGKAFDARSQLNVFKKGIEIEASKDQPVQAVSSGRLVYTGFLPGFGRVAILDHGSHYYSICARLGELQKVAGDWVQTGDVIGKTDEKGTSIYFEIRSGNVAVNPLQWITI